MVRKYLEPTTKNIKKVINNTIKNIPDKYNKLDILEPLILEDDTMLGASITTRGDGKTYGYYQATLELAMKFKDFKPMFLVRHHTLRLSLEQTIYNVLEESLEVKPENIQSKVLPNYLIIYVYGKPVCMICAIDHAYDLKQDSDRLRHFRFLIYDEFLVASDIYLPDEVSLLETIYTSVDRGENEMLPNPKILLLGNPVNFDSPLLSEWEMMSALEKQPINTVQKHLLPEQEHTYYILERKRNDKVNEKKEKTLFKDKSGSSSGMFTTARKYVASDELKRKVQHEVVIKIDNYAYLFIYYNSRKEFYLQVKSNADSYQYCYNLADVDDDIKLIKEYELNSEFGFYYEKGKILFADTYSLNYIMDSDTIKSTNIYALMKKKGDVPKVELNTRNYEVEHLKRTKARLVKEYERI